MIWPFIPAEGQSTRFVTPVNPGALHPYTTWATAATNIQDAVDAAAPGDTVLLTNGVYYPPGRIWVTNGITVTSANGPDVTVVDRQGDDEGCFWISHADAVVERLTLTGGGWDEGGGAYIYLAGTLRHCLVYSNYAFSGGAGVYLEGGGIVSNCFIYHNRTDRGGGGVYCDNGGVVTHSTLYQNLAQDGGGIGTEDSGLIQHCDVFQNAARFGGGIYAYNAVVEFCTIVSNGNWTIPSTACGGGGLQMSDAIVRHCTIKHNQVTNNYARGGGVRLRGDSTLENCLVVSNHVAGYYAEGGGVHCENDFNTVQNVHILHNRAASSHNFGGGGLFFNYADNTYARNCLIAGNVVSNHAPGAQTYGAGVLFYDGGILQNCTVVSNQLLGGGGGGGIHHTARGVVENCVVQYNYDDEFLQNHMNTAVGTWRTSCTTTLVAGVGNTSADPAFVDPAAGDYRLSDTSVVINAGANYEWMGAATDLDGGPRIRVGIVDMGAYEREPIALRATLLGAPRSGWDEVSVVFTAYVGGANTTLSYLGWDVNADGVADLTGTNLLVVTNVYGPGFYDVELTVSNTSGERVVFRQSDYIRVYPSIVRVATNGGHVFPFANWTTAATNPAAAMAATRDGTVVLVSNGTFYLTAEVAISNAVSFRSVNGFAETVIHGSNSVRCFNVAHTGAVVEGFTVTNGVAVEGGGIYLSKGLVRNCFITGNRATAGGTAGGGVRMLSGTALRNCLVVGNRAPSSGGGKGGGISAGAGSVVENCTVVKNSAYSNAGGIQGGGAVVNCIVVSNTAAFDTNYLAIVASYTCTTPLPPGPGNFTNAPRFVATNDFHLLPSSPCRDSGIVSNWMASATDLDGRPRLFNTLVDVGCYEYSTSTLACTFMANPTDGRAPLTTVLTALVAGTNTAITWYGWDLDDDGTFDRSGPGLAVITNTYVTALNYSVRLAVSNTAGEVAEFTRADYIRVQPVIYYVAQGGSHTPPYSTWAMAATNIQSALNLAATGTTVIVSNGTYFVNETVRVTRNMTLRSLHGPVNTIIDGLNAIQCLLITNPLAVVDGFTITRGRTDAIGEGAGVKMTAGTLQNCIIRNNTVCSGSASRGGGVYAFNAVIRNCLIRDNSVTCGNAQGGGLYGWSLLVENCTVVSNRAVHGGGVFLATGATSRNCIVVGNTGTSTFPNWNTGVFVNTCSSPLPPGAGNMEADPLFVDPPAADYHLLLGSPCVDAGVASPRVSNDLDRVDRPLDGNHDGAAAIDLGAYEFIHPEADTDGDGLRDSNEVDFGTSPARSDTDGDRSNDGEELRAGTDPLDPLSLFQVSGFGFQVSGPVIQWSSVAGKRYDLARTTNLMNEFQSIFTNIPATPPMNVHTDATASSVGPWIYRIELE